MASRLVERIIRQMGGEVVVVSVSPRRLRGGEKAIRIRGSFALRAWSVRSGQACYWTRNGKA